jgi:hypothetical protein
MDRRHWIRLLAWLQKNKANSNSPQIKFAPKLGITREDGWAYLELQLVNRSSWRVWVEEASVVLAHLDANYQTGVPAGKARYQIFQNVSPNETLSVRFAGVIYDAAGRPQRQYSCLVSTNVRYRSVDEWCDAKLQTYYVEMEALGVLSLHSERWYDKKMERINARY